VSDAYNTHAVRRWINRLAQLLELAKGCPEDLDFYSVSGDVVCRDCGEPFWRHAVDPWEPWLTMLCNGERVKL
jgi:hypothetical protein